MELAYRLDTARLLRQGFIKPGYTATGTLRWSYPWDEIEEVSITVSGYTLTAQLADEPPQTIALQTTRQPFGGVRWWLTCPYTRRRCRALFLPNPRRIFASRQAYRLVYRTQQMSPEDRAFARVHKIEEALENPPHRRRHTRTIDRLVAKLEAAEANVDGYWLARVARLPGLRGAVEEMIGEKLP